MAVDVMKKESSSARYVRLRRSIRYWLHRAEEALEIEQDPRRTLDAVQQAERYAQELRRVRV